jgi:hypothetical protein
MTFTDVYFCRRLGEGKMNWGKVLARGDRRALSDAAGQPQCRSSRNGTLRGEL